MYVCMSVCVCLYVCMYTYMHVYMHVWMHGCMDVYCILYINNLAYLNYDVYLRLKMGDQPPSIAISIGKMMIDIGVFGRTLFIRQTQMSLRCFGGKLPGSHFVPNELFLNSFPSTNPTSTVWSVWYDVWQLAIWPLVLCQHPTEHRPPLICRDPCNSQEINGIFHCIHVSTFVRITPSNQGSICPEGNKGLLAGMKFLHVLEAILHRRAVTTTGRTAPCHDLGICRSHKRFHQDDLGCHLRNKMGTNWHPLRMFGIFWVEFSRFHLHQVKGWERKNCTESPTSNSSISPECSKSLGGGLDFLHTLKLIPHSWAVTTSIRITPGYHSSIFSRRCEGACCTKCRACASDVAHIAQFIQNFSAVPASLRLAPGNNLPIHQCRKSTVSRHQLLHISELILHFSAITARIWVAPGRHPSILQDRGEGSVAGHNSLHPAEPMLHCSAVPTGWSYAPGDHSILRHGCESEIRCLQLLHLRPRMGDTVGFPILLRGKMWKRLPNFLRTIWPTIAIFSWQNYNEISSVDERPLINQGIHMVCRTFCKFRPV